MKIQRLLILLAVLVSFAIARPVDDHGALTVQNGVIVDKTGKPAQLRGMSLFWDIYSEGSPFYNSTAIGQLANTWKSDLVRAAIGGGSINNAKAVIDAAISNGMYVLVDWHKHNIETENAKTFFRDISLYVKNTHNNAPNVIYEIYNEPINDSWANIKTYASAVITEIRKNSPSNLILVGTPSYSSVITAPIGGSAAAPVVFTQKSDFVSGTNIGYSFHFYASEAAHEKYMGWLTKARCNGVPVFITEWGVSQANGTGTLDWPLIRKWVNFMENSKVSWAAWSLANKNETSAVLTPGTQANQVGNSGNWSTAGTYLQRVISQLNTQGTHADVSSSTIACPTSSSSTARVPGGGSTDQVIEAEDYLTVNGMVSQSLATASGGAFLGSVSEGDQATYWVSATVTKQWVTYVKLRSTSNAGQIHWSIGGFSGSWPVPDSMTTGGWVYHRMPMTIPTGTNNLTLRYTGFNNDIDLDNFSFQAISRNDSIAFGFIDSLGNILVPTRYHTTSHNPIYAVMNPHGLTIEANGHVWSTIEIRTLSGQLHSHWPLASNESHHLIPSRSLPKGVFLVVAFNHRNERRSLLIPSLR